MASDLGDVYLRQIATPAERRLHAGPADAAPDFAVKECLIKAVGGRPSGFTWHDFERAPAGRGPGAAVVAAEAIDLLDEAAADLGAATGIALSAVDSYTVRGASRTAALARLAPDPRDRDGHEAPDPAVIGAARWGLDANVLVALAVVTTSAKTTIQKGASGCP
ncbi:holo-[acyl-carrier protein] synthase [Actinoalloteichus hoggarensis]|uniref:phosphopantetheinyl transferase n=1 Tax=Actinoalloteichus hoggarensis TaxID=1470176 RepID=UPI001794B8AF|nr:holo-[acyl-carrier protein] synthase [Actinoalloteichus hoggarensis]